MTKDGIKIEFVLLETETQHYSLTDNDVMLGKISIQIKTNRL